MSTVIRDLWPEDIKSEEIISPQAILEYQAKRLEARTNGVLGAHVVRLAGEDRIVLGFEVESPLAGSRVRLFSAQHRVDFEYPVAVIPPDDSLPDFLKERVYLPSVGEMLSASAVMSKVMGPGLCVENKWVASSPAEFSKMVQDVLAQRAVKATVLSLLSRASRERPTDDANRGEPGS
jgi:hypothetical protein